jgi:hypothetical protein
VSDSDAAEPGDKRELVEAFDKVVNRERERVVESASVPQARRTGAIVVVLCVLAWGGLAYTWFAKPAWLFPPDPSKTVTPQQREAALRFGIYLERERVLLFLKRHGHLPKTLAEAGVVEEGVEYVVSGDSTFVVTGGIGNQQFRLNESESAEELLQGTGVKPPARP